MRLDGVAPQFSESELREFSTQLKKLPPEMQQEYQAENQPVQKAGRKNRNFRSCARALPQQTEPPVKRVGGIMARYYHYCALLRRSHRGKNRTALLLPAARVSANSTAIGGSVICCGSRKSNPPRNCGTCQRKADHELEVLTQKRKYLYNHKEVPTPDVLATGDWREPSRPDGDRAQGAGIPARRH